MIGPEKAATSSQVVNNLRSNIVTHGKTPVLVWIKGVYNNFTIKYRARTPPGTTRRGIVLLAMHSGTDSLTTHASITVLQQHSPLK